MKTDVADAAQDIRGKILAHEGTISNADGKADDLDARLATMTTQMIDCASRLTAFTQSLDDAPSRT